MFSFKSIVVATYSKTAFTKSFESAADDTSAEIKLLANENEAPTSRDTAQFLYIKSTSGK